MSSFVAVEMSSFGIRSLSIPHASAAFGILRRPLLAIRRILYATSWRRPGCGRPSSSRVWSRSGERCGTPTAGCGRLPGSTCRSRTWPRCQGRVAREDRADRRSRGGNRQRRGVGPHHGNRVPRYSHDSERQARAGGEVHRAVDARPRDGAVPGAPIRFLSLAERRPSRRGV